MELFESDSWHVTCLMLLWQSVRTWRVGVRSCRARDTGSSDYCVSDFRELTKGDDNDERDESATWDVSAQCSMMDLSYHLGLAKPCCNVHLPCSPLLGLLAVLYPWIALCWPVHLSTCGMLCALQIWCGPLVLPPVRKLVAPAL
eukprot:1413742-Amphidinium_carterae.2